jgi:hypothetical protein
MAAKSGCWDAAQLRIIPQMAQVFSQARAAAFTPFAPAQFQESPRACPFG